MSMQDALGKSNLYFGLSKVGMVEERLHSKPAAGMRLPESCLAVMVVRALDEKLAQEHEHVLGTRYAHGQGGNSFPEVDRMEHADNGYEPHQQRLEGNLVDTDLPVLVSGQHGR